MKFYLTYTKTSNGVLKSEAFATELEADTRAAALMNADESLIIYLSAPTIKYETKKFVKTIFVV